MIAQHIILRGCGYSERLLWTISQRASFGLPQNLVQCVHALFLDSVVLILNHLLDGINTFIVSYGHLWMWGVRALLLWECVYC